MADNVIVAENLTKVFPSREEKKFLGLFGRRKDVLAVDRVSFTVRRGEILGYLGENGSGKTTTIKMLAGILTPTSGRASVLGYTPWERKREYLKRIGVVFGGQTLLFWDIPAWEAFKFYRDVYEVPEDEFQRRIEYFDSVLGIKKIAGKPVRKMSLGEKMKCNLVAALLHGPEVVFLDEPTIGLDALAKEAVRDFIRTLNKEKKLTVMLTTHDVLDVEALCTRVILLDKGRKVFHGRISELKRRYLGYKIVYAEYDRIKNKSAFHRVTRAGRLVGRGNNWIELEVKADENLPRTVAGLFRAFNVIDLDVREPGLDELLVRIYGENKSERG